MKNITRLIPILFAAVIGISLWNCRDDKDEPINANQIPDLAQQFINTYYPNQTVVKAVKNKDKKVLTYEVNLSNGDEIEFSSDGNWLEVNAPDGQTIPSGFYPGAIDYNINLLPGDDGINEISRVNVGFEVKTLSGLELYYTPEGELLGERVE